MDTNNLVFLKSNRLPFLNEIIHGIVDYSPCVKSEKCRKAVNSVITSIYELWEQIFDSNYLVNKNNSRDKLKRILEKYDSEVRMKNGSSRKARREFFMRYDFLFDLKRPEVEIQYQSLSDFYDDQKNKRRLIIEDVDIEVVRSKIEEEIESDEIDVDENLEEFLEETASASHNLTFVNRSGLERSLNDQERSILNYISEISFRDGKNFKNDITEALALGCVDAGVTINQGRKFCKSFFKTYFKVDLYLDGAEVPNSSSHESFDDGDSEYSPTIGIRKRSQRKDLNEETLESPKKKPFTNEEYMLRYQRVLPCTKTITRKMHTLAIVAECNAAQQLLEKGPDDKSTLHYDSTTRRKVQGEMTSLVLEFSNGNTLKLRPLLIAKETQESVANFIVMEIKRLAIAAESDPVKIWECVDALMTDAAAKNLSVESIVSQLLGK
jgi:hypothetical protein